MKKTYDFQKQEKKWQKFWEKEKIFKFNPKKKGKIFSIDTPPPTVSGKMHLGHAFSYTHQDIIARYHRMKGENIFYPFGTDDNGLPTEKLVERENQVKLFELGRESFVKLCRLTIKRILPDFIADWKGIGMSCDFSQIYSTISPEVQKLSQKYFIELYKRRRIYRKSSPTLWCPECQTAIAQAELENRETDSFFVDIEFEIEGGQRIIVATTRPELLASCIAIFVHPQDNRFKHLIGQAAIVPLFGQKVKILSDRKVDVQKGTGAVMCCTFGDTTDIDWYFEHKLPLRLSVARDGKMHQLAGEFAGLPAKEARIRIIEKLKEKGLVKDIKNIVHSVNVHERCGREIEILPTTQWFIRYLDLKKHFLEQSQKLNWHPLYMKTRLNHWIEGLRWDWCISRQRYFGIPIPVWYCKNCGEIILPKESDLPVDPLHSKPKKKCRCKSSEFIPESDVLDTWLTSSLSPQIALDLVKDKKMRDKMFPMSLRPQAHDIINFWLFYTLARSYLHFKNVPWQEVMISGFVLDPKGEKMSKSKGNVIEPQTIIEKYGADAMRFWSAQSNLGYDLRYSEEEIKIGKRTAVKIWNASRFCLTHLKNYKPQKSDIRKLVDEDKWILAKLYRTAEEYVKKMEKYEYAGAKKTLDNFFWKDFCDNYLEIVKLRVYSSPLSSHNPSPAAISDRRSRLKAAQFTLYTTLLSVLKLYAPIMPHITEEIYQQYFKKQEVAKSIHLTKLPKLNKKLYFSKTAGDFDLVIDAVVQIRKYKSGHRLSMKTEIEEASIKTQNKAKIKKYLPLISRLMAVARIELV